MKTHSGSVSVELVLLTPVLVSLMLLGVYSGRASEATIQVRHAADQAARAASQVKRAKVEATAREVAIRSLAKSGTACADVTVLTSVTGYWNDKTVVVVVECKINTAGLQLLHSRDRFVRASSSEILDRWRVDS